MSRILIIEGDLATRELVKKMLAYLGEEFEINRPSNTFELTIPRRHNESICTNYTPDREHGWYRKFEKSSKNRNFK